MKVLVADPNPLVRDVVKLALVPAGWEVELVADGVSALAYLNEAKSPVIAYLSTELTGTTALSLIQKFSQRDAERGVFPVLMSLRCDPKVVVEALSAGAMDFLFLPTEPEVIRAKAEVNNKVMRRLEGAGACGVGAVEVDYEATPANVRATYSTLGDKFRKVQTFATASSHIVSAISGLGLDAAVEVEKHVYAEKEPSFAMWCTIVAPHASIWVDVLVESDRKSAMLLFERLTGMPAESGRDALDTVGEVVNIVQGAIKSGLQAEGHEVMTPVVPKPVATANLPKLNEYIVDRVRVSVNAGGILLSVTLFVCSRPVVRKTVESLRAKDVTVESLPMVPGVDLKLVNRGVMLDDRAVSTLREKLTGESRRLALNVIEAPALLDLLRGA
jgi:DNA-binding response OmpR family regulator